jgi:hypothetical protein
MWENLSGSEADEIDQAGDLAERPHCRTQGTVIVGQIFKLGEQSLGAYIFAYYDAVHPIGLPNWQFSAHSWPASATDTGSGARRRSAMSKTYGKSLRRRTLRCAPS